MSTYEHTVTEGSASLKLSEQHLYGSSRIGMRAPEAEMIGAQLPDDQGLFEIVRGMKRYELTNHLGNVLSVITDTKQAVYDSPPTVLSYYLSTVISYTDYYPFGAPMDNGNSADDRSWSGGYRYGFNGKESDDEVKGDGNHISFNDYGYDTRLARRLRTDPHFYNYPSISSYAAFANNPIINLDPDGKDIVYFNLQGTETHRVKSNTEFKTFIMSNAKAGDPKLSTVGWKEVAMPKIIEERNGEATTSTNYQDNDYVIAARTGYFNQSKNAGVLNLYTEGGNAIPKEAVQAIPDLDPTLVKAVAMQESNLGTTGVTDIMQANVPGDWSAMKAKYGLVKSESTSVTNSLYGGIRLLATKGFKGGITYDPKTGKSTYTFQGWNKAVGSYNGGGTANYQQNVTEMQQNATTPECSDYTDECP